MAGGMSKRGSWGSMRERSTQTPREPSVAPQPPLPVDVKHVWVLGAAGRVPGLLLGWRQRGSVWSGRVVRPVYEEGEWVVLEEYVDAGLLERA